MKCSWFGRFAVAAALVMASSVGVQAQVGSTSATVRGTVLSQAGAPVAAAQITVRNISTGVTKGALANESGQYVVPFLQPGGPYTVSVQSLGFGAAAREFDRLALGEVLVVNFQLTTQAVQLEGLEINVETSPVIDVRQSGVIDRVNSVQIESLPTNGRNFSDFIALAPGVSTGVGDGSGGNLSLGGGRRGATNITIDGVNNNGTFFGGEARGSDRIAFAFSIETVKEFQVITNGYDVEFGNFTGGQVNAITKSGTNDFQGSGFFYRRDESLLGDDFLGVAPGEFTSNQFGGLISGPIVRDKAHFLFSFDRQERVNPVRSLLAGSPYDDITEAELSEFQQIMQSTYGYDASNEFGFFGQTNDQNALLGRIDWNLNEGNSLTLRYNYTDLINANDRVSDNEGVSNGGDFEDTAHSFAASLKSVLSPTVFNDLRVQYATEKRPRVAYSQIPELEIFDVSSINQFQDIEIFNDPVLSGNNIEEDVLQIVDNLTFQMGDHTLKVGTNNQFYDLLNLFAFAGAGQFEFEDAYGNTALENLATGTAAQYDVGISLDGSPLGLTEYNVSEHAFYIQDDWSFNDRLTLNLGLRWDYTRLTDAAPRNPTFDSDFGLDNTVMPDDKNNFSPRVGFAYDLMGDGSSVLRGGAGLFYGRIPAVFWSNVYLNNGVSQSSVRCQGSFFDTDAARTEVIRILSGERETFRSCQEIPGASAASLPTPNINAIADGLELPGAWKFNLGYDTEISEGLRLGVDVTHSRTDKNFYVAEQNLRDPGFTVQGGRPVFADVGDIEGDGEPGFGDNRLTNNFNEALLVNDEAESRTWTATFELDKRFDERWSAGASYALSRTEDNSSFSCCFHNTAIQETPTARGPNDIGDPGDELTGTWGPADFDRTHVVTMNAVYRDAFGVSGLQLSGFYRGQSGLPYTPKVNGDVNGDGRDENDRAFLGSSTQMIFETADDLSLYGELLGDFECLAEQQGRIATRNSCRNSWQHRLDGRASFRLPTLTGQNVEFIADVFNVLNLVNSDWGVFESVSSNDQNVFQLEGFDPISQRHIYSVNEDFGDETPFGFTPQQWQIQLGVRYNIN